jgi:predicted Zn-dependent protease
MSTDTPSRGPSIHVLPIVVAAVIGLFIVLKGCQEGPFGRHQVVGLSPGQEAQLGAQAFDQVLRESEVDDERPVVDAVKRVAGRLEKATSSPDVLRALRLKPQDFQWKVSVVRSRQVNAFCLPGGKIVVYTGILPVCRTEAGLATVLGHEIGHALAHHGAERMAQQQLIELGQQAVTSSMGDLDPERQREILGLLGAGSKFGIELPFSRRHESEADHIGLILMSAAGYDPREAIRFWERMEKAGDGRQPPEFASTHPSHERRAEALRRWLPEVLPLYEKSDKADGDRLLPLPR